MYYYLPPFVAPWRFPFVPSTATLWLGQFVMLCSKVLYCIAHLGLNSTETQLRCWALPLIAGGPLLCGFSAGEIAHSWQRCVQGML